MRLVFMGTPGFAVPVLERLVSNRSQVVAVYTRPDQPAGRGRTLTASPVKGTAKAYGLQVVQPERLNTAPVLAELASFQPDIIVVAAYGQLLPGAVLELPRYGCVNIHPSLLPRHRGAAPAVAAILAGDEFTGVSLMQMDEGMDTGPVLLQAQVPVAPFDTAGTLLQKLSPIAAGLLLELLARLPQGDITPRPQAEAAATYSRPVSRADSEIDWRRPAAEIWRQVRAYQPWPGSHTRWRGKQLKIIEAVPLTGKNGKAGEVSVMPGEKEMFAVATGDGRLGVKRIQVEGKRAMPAGEFLRGQPGFVGAVLPQGRTGEEAS